MKKVLLIFFFLGLIFPVLAQEPDSLQHARDSIALAKANRKKTYSVPRRASIMSALLPGLGQAYNSFGQPFRKTKYWKIPIIYGGFAGLGYMFKVNNEEYNFFRENLRAENDDDPTTINKTRWSTEDLLSEKVKYRKRRDIAAVGIVLIYVLNIIDANVDAHLKTFDVSDDLSLHVEPWQSTFKSQGSRYPATGLSLVLNFK